jgi:uncharacterized protein YndB with AHSA1/START domain
MTVAETEFVIEPGRQDILMTRVFDAPRDLVFRAVTDPGIVARWWGPSSMSTRVDTMELRPGGLWRFVNVAASGEEFGFRGVYHDVTAPTGFVRTWTFEGAPEDVALEIVTLDELNDGQTRFTDQSVHRSVAARDDIVRAGGPEGGTDGMDALAAVIADLRSQAGRG